MLYAIISEDVPNSLPLRKQARPAHLARLNDLMSQNRLTIAGPHPIGEHGSNSEGFSGSLVVAEFGSFEEAKQWADDDPYVAAGIYASVAVKPLNKVLP